MAIKLTQGADATIATAAARAGMGAVPKDLSGSFETISQGQIDLMNVYSKQGAELINSTLEIAAPLIKEAAERIKTKAGFGGNPNMVNSVSERWKNHRENKPKRRDFKNTETGEFDKKGFREAREAWNDTKNQILNEGQYARNGIQKTLQQVAAGDIDPVATGAEDLLWHATISQQGDPIKTGKSKGLYAETGYKGDVLGFYMKDSNGNYIKEINEQGQIISTTNNVEEALWKDSKDVEALVVPKQTEAISGIDQISGAFQDFSQKTGEDPTPTMFNMARKKVGEAIATENGWKALTKNRGLAGSDISYFDAISGDDIELSNEILNVITAQTEGFTDIDGDGKVSKGDFDKDGDGILSEEELKDVTILANMNILRREAMNFNNPQAKEAFMDWTEKQFRIASEGGKSLYKEKNPRTSPSTDTQKVFGINVDDTVASVQVGNSMIYVKGQDKINTVYFFKDAEASDKVTYFTAFTGANYKYDGKLKRWYLVTKNEEGETVETLIRRDTVINDLGFVTNNEIMNYIGAATTGMYGYPLINGKEMNKKQRDFHDNRIRNGFIFKDGRYIQPNNEFNTDKPSE